MGRSRSLIQIYAIVVNIVAVITFITCTTNLISSFIDKQDPFYSSRSSQNLSSFEEYKMEKMKAVDKEQAYIPSDSELQSMYDAAKQAYLNRVLHGINRSLIVNGVILLLSLVFFLTHWMLMKKYERDNSGNE